MVRSRFLRIKFCLRISLQLNHVFVGSLCSILVLIFCNEIMGILF